MLGYGFPEEDYRRGLERQPDAVILDSGSTDPGPYMLGTGTTMVKPRAYVRDLKVILEGIGDKKIPLLIGSAGGAGFDGNVDYIVNTIKDLCGKSRNYQLFKHHEREGPLWPRLCEVKNRIDKPHA